ncbi:MAG TPA: serine hydrolase domain-containing protein [Chitinophagaceae bacterium]|nr:serine hydrolase domain-containing protein [Chitinophagaceae bacterium]
MQMTSRRGYLALLFIFTIMEATAQLPAPVNDSLDSIFTSYFKEGQPGGAVLIAIDGRVVYKKAWGVEDIETKKPITSQTSFNLGSISKTVVAYAILQLAQQNKLSLQDDLLKFFPEFKNRDIARKVKIFHLLTHTSGLPDSRRVQEEHDFYLTAKDAENWAPLLQTAQLEFEPGTKYKYSNPAFNGLALIIEKVSGQKWQDYVKAAILQPSGMKHADITDGPHPASGVAHAYVLNRDNKFEELDYGEEPTFAAAGNGGVWGSVEDMWQYEQAIRQSVFLPAEWINLSRTVYPMPGWKDSIAPRLGFSWFLTKDTGQDLIGHTGSQGGFVSDYCWWPGKKIFYTLLSNKPVPVQAIRQQVFSLPYFDFIKQ